jgi:hypothetical protein
MWIECIYCFKIFLEYYYKLNAFSFSSAAFTRGPRITHPWSKTYKPYNELILLCFYFYAHIYRRIVASFSPVAIWSVRNDKLHCRYNACAVSKTTRHVEYADRNKLSDFTNGRDRYAFVCPEILFRITYSTERRNGIKFCFERIQTFKAAFPLELKKLSVILKSTNAVDGFSKCQRFY